MIQIRRATIALAAIIIAGCVSAPPVNGDWDIMLTAPEGSTGFPITIEANGAEATASGGDTDFSGTWEDGQLKLTGEFFVTEAGYAAPLEMTMQLEDGQLTGSATWDQFEVDVLGTRSQ